MFLDFEQLPYSPLAHPHTLFHSFSLSLHILVTAAMEPIPGESEPPPARRIAHPGRQTRRGAYNSLSELPSNVILQVATVAIRC